MARLKNQPPKSCSVGGKRSPESLGPVVRIKGQMPGQTGIGRLHRIVRQPESHREFNPRCCQTRHHQPHTIFQGQPRPQHPPDQTMTKSCEGPPVQCRTCPGKAGRGFRETVALVWSMQGSGVDLISAALQCNAALVDDGGGQVADHSFFGERRFGDRRMIRQLQFARQGCRSPAKFAAQSASGVGDLDPVETRSHTSVAGESRATATPMRIIASDKMASAVAVEMRKYGDSP